MTAITETRQKASRVIYFDYLRIIAILVVVLGHSLGAEWASIDCTSYEWRVLNMYRCGMVWCLGILTMISGALFLNPAKKIRISTIYTKNILRMVTAFIFWSGLYAIKAGIDGAELNEVVKAFFAGHYHLWYIFMIIGLYVVTPLIRLITADEKATRYFLVFGFFAIFLIPRIFDVLALSSNAALTGIVEAISNSFNFTYLNMITPYTYFFILGYYLHSIDIGASVRKIIYILGLVGYAATFLLTTWYSAKVGHADASFAAVNSLAGFMMIIALYVFAKYVLARIRLHPAVLKFILHLSRCSFGIYLFHAFVLDIVVNKFGFTCLSFNPVFCLPLLALCVSVITYLIIAILERIPFLNKHIL